MGLFDDPISQVRAFLNRQSIDRVDAADVDPWPVGASLILQEDTALELGNPGIGSISILAWTDSKSVCDGVISRIGPDLDKMEKPSVALAQVLLVAGAPEEPLAGYQDLRDAVLDTRLEGFMTRSLPSRQTVWCRVGHQARDRGFRLAHLGAALIGALRTVPFVTKAEAIFVTADTASVAELKPAADLVGRIVGAMRKMSEEPRHDCESCEYWDVCKTVEELQKLRKQRQEERT